MDDIIGAGIKLLIEGRSATDVALILLGLFVVYLLKERKSLINENKEKDEKIDKIINDYYKGNLTLAEALNSLKLVLYEIKGKIS